MCVPASAREQPSSKLEGHSEACLSLPPFLVFPIIRPPSSSLPLFPSASPSLFLSSSLPLVFSCSLSTSPPLLRSCPPVWEKTGSFSVGHVPVELYKSTSTGLQLILAQVDHNCSTCRSILAAHAMCMLGARIHSRTTSRSDPPPSLLSPVSTAHSLDETLPLLEEKSNISQPHD